MVGPFREKAKKSYKPKGSNYNGGIANRHQQKTDDIKRALVHRARIKKKYYQMLESEGLSKDAKDDLPKQSENRYEDGGLDVVAMPGAEDYSESENEFEGEQTQVEVDLDMADSEDEEIGELVGTAIEDNESKVTVVKSSKSKPGSRLSYAERAKLVKQRKKEQSEQREREYQNRQKEKAKKLEAKEKTGYDNGLYLLPRFDLTMHSS
ncbi:hypothetical protein NADFUDRAFT_75862 [Nadsonia fulvescens var. elongata DSM 6958]|uniref:rRNA-processing protein FYV7 n=1 Tax=Nadsonia fulvescens var. elongata DSM 6958 TaxID=857566 RepID=A0A1E3PD35_9ASCO|nr:hypothetical protein NADFUDRAFT_75862 [Nadsonia fulvescens var. elongata DSM 6958]